MEDAGLTPEQKRRKKQKREWDRKYDSTHREQRRAAGRARYRRIKEKIRAYDKARRIKDREKIRESDRRYNGMPEPTRPCPEFCECCGGSQLRRAFHLDHDHTTGKFRGWLCSRCNAGIGMMGDDIIGLALGIAYLEMVEDVSK